jgi:hypothetical protein
MKRNAGKNGGEMRLVSVYRVNYARKTRVLVGTVIERRGKERGDNMIGLLRLARKKFAASPEEAFFIALDRKGAGLSHGVEGRIPPPH